MIMVSLQSFIEYLARLLNRRQKRERQIAVQMVGASILLSDKNVVLTDRRLARGTTPFEPPRNN